MATSSTFSTRIQTLKYNIEVIENSTSIPDNTSSITVYVKAWCTSGAHTFVGTSYCTINGTNYRQDVASTQIRQQPVTIFTKSVTIPHNADGTKSIYVEARLFDDGLHDYISIYNGFTVVLSNIPRGASLTNAESFNDEGNPTIKYNNPAGNAVTTLQACITNSSGTVIVAYRDISKRGTSYTFNLTTAERNALRNATPNSNALDVKFQIKTVCYGTTFTSAQSASMSIVNANPVASGITYKDTNATTVAVTTDNQKIVQNKSNLQINFASLTALKGASLTSVAVTINSVTKSVALSGSSTSNVSLNWGTVNTSQNIIASIQLTDSRGNNAMTTLMISVYEYHSPFNACTAKRVSNFYDETILTGNIHFSSLGGHNHITASWEYKLRSSSTWTAGGSITQDEEIHINLDNTKSYDVRFTATDVWETSIAVRIVPVGTPMLFFDTELNSIGVKAMPKGTDQIAVGANMHLLSQSGNLIAQLVRATSGNEQFPIMMFYTDAPSGSQKNLMQLQTTGYGAMMLMSSYQGVNTIQLTGGSGNIRCVDLTQTSSRKVKDNITEMPLAEAVKILQLTAVAFDYKIADSKDHRGFIAEDVNEIIPQLVTEETENAPAGLNYLEMIPYLQTVIKAQEERIKALEDRLADLEKKLENNK